MKYSLKIRYVAGMACLLFLFVSGCGKSDGEAKPTGKVSGTVTLGKKPLAQGSIAFLNPETGESFGAPIKDGKFSIENPVTVGKYQVTVNPPEATQPESPDDIKNLRKQAKIPSAYQDGSKSGLTAEVKEGENTFDFPLSTKGPQRASGGRTPP